MARMSWAAALVLLATVSVGWLGVPPVRYPLQPGRVYAVAVQDNRATFDLPLAGPAEQYLLVVSNVAAGVDSLGLRLSATAIDEPRWLPLTQVEPLAAAPLDGTLPAPPATPRGEAPRQRTFWLNVAAGSPENPAAYRPIVTELAAEGQHVRVYVDIDDRVTQQTTDQIVERMDHAVWPMAAARLGLPRDIDGDGTLAIVLTSWLGRLTDGTTSVGGLVLPDDFRTDLKAPFSNRADALYLNANVRPGDHLETLLAHEFAHTVTISGRLAEGDEITPTSEEEAWLNEAISHVAENLQSGNWSNLDYHLASYLNAPYAAPLVVANYQDAGLWRAAGPRGSTYLFLRWCVDRYGVELLPRLIHSQRRGAANLEAATGAPFAELYRRFAVDLFLNTTRAVATAEPARSSQSLPRADLAQPLGAWGLCGPRFDLWDTSDELTAEQEVSVVGTSSRYFVLAAERAGPRRITIQAPPGTALQVTLVRLPDTLPRLQMAVEPAGQGQWQLSLRERTGRPVALSQLVWDAEEMQPSSVGSTAHVALAADGLSSLFDALSIPAGGMLASRPVAFAGLPVGPVRVRVMGQDDQGRRVAAWATLDPNQSHLRLAAVP